MFFVLFVVHSDSLDVRVIRAGKGEETTKSTKKSKNETLDAVLRERYVEVDKQTGSNPGQLHVGQQLRRVYSDQFLDALC